MLLDEELAEYHQDQSLKELADPIDLNRPTVKLLLVFESAIRGRGAFRRFRNLAERLGIIDEWYDYKEKEQKQLSIEWCEENGFNYE
ncbi:MAG: hypothetical protein SOW34_12825 [Oliverpabstia sp.]|nr:hypothetical protein [Oliverpabstia sp.]